MNASRKLLSIAATCIVAALLIGPGAAPAQNPIQQPKAPAGTPGFNKGFVQPKSPAVPTGIEQGKQIGTILRRPVPDVTRRTESEAQSALINAGFKPGAVHIEAANGFEAGTVFRQSPLGKRLEIPGTPVETWVTPSKPIGLSQTTVPPLGGMLESQAESRLKDVRLRLGRVDRRPSDQPSETVIAQSQPAGSGVPIETAIDVTLSERLQTPVGVPPAKTRILVPRLQQKTIAEARAILADRGLRLGQVSGPGAREPSATVSSQDPPAEFPVAPRTFVNVTVIATTIVPPMVGSTRSRALRQLNAARLRSGKVYPVEVDDKAVVRSQSYVAGSSVPIDTVIDLVMTTSKERATPRESDTPNPHQAPIATRTNTEPKITGKPEDRVPTTRVPSLDGSTLADAQESLTVSGLELGRVAGTSPRAKGAVVVSQDPAAGTSVATGSAVSVAMANETAVPELSTHTIAEAKSLLHDAQLRLGSVSRVETPGARGTIKSQSIPPGRLVAFDSLVDVEEIVPWSPPWALIVAAGVALTTLALVSFKFLPPHPAVVTAHIVDGGMPTPIFRREAPESELTISFLPIADDRPEVRFQDLSKEQPP